MVTKQPESKAPVVVTTTAATSGKPGTTMITTTMPGKPGTTTVATTTAGTTSPSPGLVKKATYTDDEVKNMTILRITEPLSFDLIAQETGIDKKLLVRWNSDYDLFIYNTYPTPFYNLRLPKDKLDAFLAKKDMLTRKSKQIFAQAK